MSTARRDPVRIVDTPRVERVVLAIAQGGYDFAQMARISDALVRRCLLEQGETCDQAHVVDRRRVVRCRLPMHHRSLQHAGVLRGRRITWSAPAPQPSTKP